MKKAIILFSLFIGLLLTRSCLVPPSPRYHYFVSDNKITVSDPKVKIFSTPKIKNYVITNISPDVDVFITSPAFEDPEEFYPLQNEDFLNAPAKQYVLKTSDKNFYHSDAYKDLSLKIVSGDFEHTIHYRLEENSAIRK